MNELTLFTYSGREVRTVLVDGEPWFIARDVVDVLDLYSTAGAVRLLDDDEKGVRIMHTPGGDQQMSIVNEPGLYSLILRSRKPEAKAFKRWITHDVLPAIRRTGRYAVAELTRADLARMVLAAEAEREALTTQLAELTPAATAWQQLADASGDYSVRDAAHLLNRAGIATGQQRLFATLRELRWIDSHGRPYQTQIETGRIAARTRTYDHPHTGEPTLSVQVRITAKGVTWLRDYLDTDPAVLASWPTAGGAA